MKNTIRLFTAFLAVMMWTVNVRAQENKWSVKADLVSNYIWRGLKFGNGAALQPGIEYSNGGFTAGAWGSYNITDAESPESDLYVGYTFNLGESSTFGVSLTDYFFPGKGSRYFDASSHYFEPAVSLNMCGFNLMAAYMISNKPESSGTDDTEDFYVQAGYTAGPVDIFIGGGNGQYSLSGNFNISNIGIGTSKEIKITDSFCLPVFGQVILNPNTEQFYVVAGLSL